MASPGGSDEAPKGQDPQPSSSSPSSSSSSISRDSNMASKLQNSASLTIQLLQEITDNFSKMQKIGQGAYGTVYKGVHDNGEEIAVKLLHNSIQGTDDEQFKREFENLMRLEHHNIVRLVGYCYETHHKPMMYKGETIYAEETNRALCFEYMRNGSLRMHISEECDGLDWHTRYKIIKGTCEGLKYLHEGFNEPIYHMDLKPDNILLDENMIPKLADFGLSKLYDGEQTMNTQNLVGTIGYLPPEYLFEHLVSKKLDIFSLGVVMTKIIAGPRGPTRRADMTYQEFIDQVHENWRKRLQESLLASQSLEAYCGQVNRCIEMALRCMDTDRHKRPNIVEIINDLNETETAISNELKNVQGHRWRRLDLARIEAPSNQITKRVAVAQGTERASRATRFNWDYTLAQLRAATNGFALEAKIGQGRFRTVYRGKLRNRREVAIKRGESSGLMAYRFQHNENAFWSELDFLSRLRHKYLVSLVGYCVEVDERLLVYDYMKNGALYDHLHPESVIFNNSSSSPVLLSWKLRIKILLDASRGIEYLHTYAVPTIIHRDIKSSNILLDGSWVAHVADFGLSLMGPRESGYSWGAGAAVQHLPMKAARTAGYADPEYYDLHHLTVKSDVYSFGVVMLEALTGKHAIFEAQGGEPMSVVGYAQPSIVAGELGKVLDGRAPEPTVYEVEAIELVAYTALHCVRMEGKDRPFMADIVANLETAFAFCNDCQ
uniref:Uncharacterized protein n=2 Tax=Avena sativa TaxID=4498 RepID=A0ACD5TXA1_AVESA